jgi:hypothetical protein
LAPEPRRIYGHFFKRGGHARGLPAVLSNGHIGVRYDPSGLVRPRGRTTEPGNARLISVMSR